MSKVSGNKCCSRHLSTSLLSGFHYVPKLNGKQMTMEAWQAFTYF